MSENDVYGYGLKAEWERRLESVDACAERLSRFLISLESIAPVFGKWRCTKKGALPLKTAKDLAVLKQWLTLGDQGKDTLGQHKDRFGYEIAISGASKEDKVRIELWCGRDATIHLNKCDFDFKTYDPGDPWFLRPGVLKQMIHAVVNAWDPDRVFLRPHVGSGAGIVEVYMEYAGWVTFLSPRYEALREMPKPSRVEKLEKGRLVRCGGAEFSARDESQMKSIESLNARIKEHEGACRMGEVPGVAVPGAEDMELILSAWWGPRKESASACADRLEELLAGLRSIDPVFEAWSWVRDKEPTTYRMPVKRKTLEEWVNKGVNRDDSREHNIIEDLGYSVWLNGQGGASDVSVKFHCGVFSAHMGSSVVIASRLWPARKKFLNGSIWKKIIQVVVKAMDPDRVVVTNFECYKVRPAIRSAGWLTYLSGKYDGLTGLPSASKVEKVGSGRLITGFKEVFSFEDPARLEFVRALDQAVNAYDKALSDAEAKLKPPKSPEPEVSQEPEIEPEPARVKARNEYVLSATWGPRAEGVEELARRVSALLIRWRAIDPELGKWDNDEKGHRAYRKPEDFDVIKEWVEKGIIREDNDDETSAPVDGLGYAVWLIGAQKSKKLELCIFCGHTDDFLGNMCQLMFCKHGAIDPRYLDISVLRRLIGAMVATLEPDTVRMTATDCFELEPAIHEAGWLTYLGAKFADLKYLPEEVQAEPMGEGRLLIVGNEPFTIDNEEQVHHLRALNQKIEDFNDSQGAQ